MAFEKGNTHGRKFKPGESGNPAGRPAVVSEVRSWARGDLPMFYEQVKKAAEAGEGWAVKLGLQLAGVPLTEDKAGETPAQPAIGKGASTEDLMAAATRGEA